MDLIDAARGTRIPACTCITSATTSRPRFKRLMGRHATRADELDRLLRGERFVDLLAVVRQALRAGVESYSIKQLEQFYAFAREVPLGDAGGASAGDRAGARERRAGHDSARGARGGARLQPGRLPVHRGAARLARRPARGTRGRGHDGVAARDEDAGRRPKVVGDLEAQQEAAARRAAGRACRRRRSDPTHPDHPRWLLAHLVGWHRREDKAQWWERYPPRTI